MGDFDMRFAEDAGLTLDFTTDSLFDFTTSESIVVGDIKQHNDLDGRDENDAHPISAISGLENELEDVPTEVITAEEILSLF